MSTDASIRQEKNSGEIPGSLLGRKRDCALMLPAAANTSRASDRRLFPQLVTWWATSVECNSALRRLDRARELSARETHDDLVANAEETFLELDRREMNNERHESR